MAAQLRSLVARAACDASAVCSARGRSEGAEATSVGAPRWFTRYSFTTQPARTPVPPILSSGCRETASPGSCALPPRGASPDPRASRQPSAPLVVDERVSERPPLLRHGGSVTTAAPPSPLAHLCRPCTGRAHVRSALTGRANATPVARVARAVCEASAVCSARGRSEGVGATSANVLLCLSHCYCTTQPTSTPVPTIHRPG